MARHLFRNHLGELIEIPESLSSARSETLDALSTKFEGLLERLQTPAVRKGLEAAFNATPAELGRAAVEAARR
jgi:hypothetical protein